MTETNTQMSDDQSEQSRRRLRWAVYLIVIGLSAGHSAANIIHVRPLLSANDRSRWCTVWSLVERGTYQIDEIYDRREKVMRNRRPWNTIDRVQHNGHVYSSKPPLLPTMAAGLYWCLKKTTGWNLSSEEKPISGETRLIVRTILLVINLLPMIAALVVIAMLVERYAQTDIARIFIVTAASSATFLTTFMVVFNNHTVAATSVVFAIYPAMRIIADDNRRPILFALSGLFAAFACTCELPAALLGVALFGILCFKDWKKTLLYFVPAALIPIAAFFVTNYLATGGWKPFYAYFGTEKYTLEIDGETPTYWAPGKAKGIDNPENFPTPGGYLWHCTFGHHGIFSLSPIFLLTLAGWAVSIFSGSKKDKDRGGPPRVFLWLGLGLTVAIFGFYLTRTASYNFGGHTSGLRWTFWLIPFFLIGMIPALDRWGRCRWFQTFAVLCLAVSAFSVHYPRNNPWTHPWIFQLMERWKWIEFVQHPSPDLSPQPRILKDDTGNAIATFDHAPRFDDPHYYYEGELWLARIPDHAAGIIRLKET